MQGTSSRRYGRRGHDPPPRERVLAATGSASPIIEVPYAEAFGQDFEDTPRRVPDITRLERTIGFRPRTTLNEILADMLD